MGSKLKFLTQKIDKLFCSYLGLEFEEIRPISVKIIGNKILVTTTIPYKRHLLNEIWDTLNVIGINKINKQNIKRLGSATGKAIAKNLFISFDKIEII
jgi:hypothetical protein